VGIGNTAPDGKFQVTGAAVGKALAILNETGDQNIFVASPPALPSSPLLEPETCCTAH
jgi:hypothetical protein